MVVTRPQNEEELQKREAIGVIRASRFVRAQAKSKNSIDIGIIYQIHKEIFDNAWPEIAGILRIENLEITDSHHKPPHFTEVPALMKATGDQFVEKLKHLKSIRSLKFTGNPSDQEMNMLANVIDTAAWIHHKITHIHSFRDGNGRTARLIANLVLERYGLVGISIKFEKENKNKYRRALQQIDQVNDYEPLMEIIYEGLIDRYSGADLKLIK
ncbi:MAG: Fic family protein [Candidatus Taylorbacteria bacterium]|nr:Fic family protein [Candidatus Taylorbacteria bacterium]